MRKLLYRLYGYAEIDSSGQGFQTPIFIDRALGCYCLQDVDIRNEKITRFFPLNLDSSDIFPILNPIDSEDNEFSVGDDQVFVYITDKDCKFGNKHQIIEFLEGIGEHASDEFCNLDLAELKGNSELKKICRSDVLSVIEKNIGLDGSCDYLARSMFINSLWDNIVVGAKENADLVILERSLFDICVTADPNSDKIIREDIWNRIKGALDIDISPSYSPSGA